MQTPITPMGFSRHIVFLLIVSSLRINRFINTGTIKHGYNVRLMHENRERTKCNYDFPRKSKQKFELVFWLKIF